MRYQDFHRAHDIETYVGGKTEKLKETTELNCMDCGFTFVQRIRWRKERYGYMVAEMAIPYCPKCRVRTDT